MAYDRSNDGFEKQPLISLREDDVRFWSNALGCSEDDLREAVDAAGQSPSDVMEFLAPTRW
jgi:hypothetical protein